MRGFRITTGEAMRIEIKTLKRLGFIYKLFDNMSKQDKQPSLLLEDEILPKDWAEDIAKSLEEAVTNVP